MNQVVADRYKIIGELGAGGMGTVYRGVNVQTGQPVAIKHLKPERTQPDIIARFKREGELLRELDHPNIVKLLDVVEENDQHYLIIEFVSGGDLNAHIRNGKLEIEQVLRLSIDLADALTRAHKLDVIHRDLKPANVLLTETGTLRLTDFGIAHEGLRERVTDPNVTMGTVDYLSPEALNGEALDSRADIWAFGVTLFEMLTGQRPFTERTISATIMRILTGTPPDLETLRPDAPVALVDLVYRMLAREREARIRSVRQVGLELEDLLHGRQIPAAAQERFATPTATVVGNTSKHNLSVFSSGFVGREEELASLGRMLDNSNTRLVTILAPGGMGKTRLALQVGQHYVDAMVGSQHSFVDGVYFVALAPLTSHETIVPAIADAIGFQFSPGGEPYQQLMGYFRRRKMLLILDNYEHLLEGVQVVSDVIQASTNLKIVVTSRERLNLSGETLFTLSGMDFPDWETPDDALTYGAVRLFVQCAKLAKGDFVLAADELLYLARICRLVAGMPLGIVLTAAWVSMLSLKEIAAEIEQSLDFLETDMRDIPERQRSIRSVFDYSYTRLSDDEQAVFRKLSVFRGGFTREAAQVVAGGSLRILASLVNKSMIRRSPESGRYEVHELLRQYLHDKLVESGAAEKVHNSHLDFFLMLAQEAKSMLELTDQGTWLRRLDHEHHNLRAALHWSAESSAFESGLQLGTALWLFWFMRGYLAEGLEQLVKLLALADATVSLAARAEAFDKAGVLARYQGDYAKAHALINEGLAIYRDLDDKQGIANSLANLGFVTLYRANPSVARALYGESLTINRELGSGQGIADSLSHLALIAYYEGDFMAARSLDEESLVIWQGLGDKQGIAWALHRLGNVILSQGDDTTAQSIFAESLAISKDLAYQWGLAWSLEDFARLATIKSEFERALRLTGAAGRLREIIGMPLPPPEQAELDHLLDLARQTLDTETANTAWINGQSMTPDQALAEIGRQPSG